MDQAAPTSASAASASEVAAAYSQVAEIYAGLFRDQLDELRLDRALLDAFVAELKTDTKLPVLDVGCGPGHVTAYLASSGVTPIGIDLSPAMITLAKAAYPTAHFRVAEMQNLEINEAAVAGIVSRYATIHTPPSDLCQVFREFARVLEPGGQLLLSFYGTDRPAQHGDAFDHKVVTAYRAGPDQMSAMLREAGITERSRTIRQPMASERFPQVTIMASR